MNLNDKHPPAVFSKKEAASPKAICGFIIDSAAPEHSTGLNTRRKRRGEVCRQTAGFLCTTEHACTLLCTAARIDRSVAALLHAEAEKICKAIETACSAEDLLLLDDSLQTSLEYTVLLEQLLLQKLRITLHKNPSLHT